MTKTKKRLLFYSAVAVFLLLSYVVIVYAEGYKYSFTENRFVRTGAISLKANNTAQIYLDGHLEGTTSFFNDYFSINGLLPGTYELKIQKDNYSVWQKKISLEEGLVTDFSKIMILPISGPEKDKVLQEIQTLLTPTATPSPTPKPKLAPKPSPTPTIYDGPFVLQNKKLFKNNDQELEKIADNVSGFVLSKYNNKLLWWTSNEVWVMWLNDTNYQPYKKNGDRSIIIRFPITIKSGAWFRDEDHIVVDSNGYKILEIDKRGELNIIKL